MHCVAYSPLGGQGSLFPNDLKERDAVARVARETGKSAAQVLLKWNLQRGVAVIPKASSEAHLRENLAGCFEWRLSNEHKVRGHGGGRQGRVRGMSPCPSCSGMFGKGCLLLASIWW